MANTTTTNKPMGSQANPEAKSSKGQGGSMMEDIKDRAQDMASSVSDKARDLAGSVSDTARDMADRAGEAFSSAQHRAQDAVGAMGEYLPEVDFKNMADDVSTLIRRYPIPSVLIGMGIGFLLARTSRNWS